MKVYLTYIGSLMLISVGLPMLIVAHYTRLYSKNVKTIRRKPLIRRKAVVS